MIESLQEREKEVLPLPINIINGIFRRKSILAFFDEPQNIYEKSFRNYEIWDYRGAFNPQKRGVKDLKPKYQWISFFAFPRKCIFYLNLLLVRNNSLIGVATRLTLSIRSRVGGGEKKKKGLNWRYTFSWRDG